jgi:orotate phosphoribosyltransferase
LRYGAVYVTQESTGLVDYWHEIVSLPRVFEWNIMNHEVLGRACIDIDGVLCRDPSAEENDDGALYQHFLAKVRPLIVPRREIGWLVTCRLEKYRALTEEWLRDNGIRYRELLMMDLPDKASRQAAGKHAVFKAMHYRKTGARLFIESSVEQAFEIARLTGKDVYCADSREMIHPGLLPKGINQPGQLLKSVLQRSDLGRQMLGVYSRTIGRK